jgi:prophage maintenance system killer protein
MRQQQFERHGGSSGLRDSWGLESALVAPQATFGEMRLLVDGDERAGANAAITFLLLGDWDPDFEPDELADPVLSVASDAVGMAALTALFEVRCRPAAAI